jgi:general secretion pathway protein J
MTAMHTARTQGGLTLLEILVAITVFAIFSAMAYGGLIRLLDNRERVNAERVYWRNVSLAFLRIERDFSLARNRPVRQNDGNVLPGSAFLGQPTDPRALGDPNVEFTRGGVLVPNGSTADLQRVGYRFVDNTLMRLAWPVLDRAPLTKPQSTPVLHDVEEFEMRFYQNGAWIDRWPPLGTTDFVLPKAVEVTVTLSGRGKFKRTFLVGTQR